MDLIQTPNPRPDSWPARLGKSGCAWVIPTAFAIAMFFREADHFLIAIAAISLSFVLPLMCFYIAFGVHSVWHTRQRVVLIVLAVIHFGLFGWLLWNKSMIWQYWL